MTVYTLHLVRHAEHAMQGHNLTGRSLNVGLSDLGQEQAAKLSTRYEGAAIRMILTSPVQRAQETALPIASMVALQPVIEPGLEEIDFGQWSGQRFDALAGDQRWAAWNSARSLACTPGGETMIAAQARAIASLMRHRDAGGTIIAVSHADIIKSILAWALGMPLDLLHRLEIAPASRSILVLGEDFARVEAVNLPP